MPLPSFDDVVEPFSIAAVMPGNAVIQLVINSNHPMGFKVKDDDNCFLTCATLGDIVEMYKNILKKPFTSTINEERLVSHLLFLFQQLTNLIPLQLVSRRLDWSRNADAVGRSEQVSIFFFVPDLGGFLVAHPHNLFFL